MAEAKIYIPDIGWHNSGAVDPLHVFAMRMLGDAISESESEDFEPSGGSGKEVSALIGWICRVACDPTFADFLQPAERGESLFPGAGGVTTRLMLRQRCAALAEELIRVRDCSMRDGPVGRMYRLLEEIAELRLKVAREEGSSAETTEE